MADAVLGRTLRALHVVARAGPDDALVSRTAHFLRTLETGGQLNVDGLADDVDAWLAQMAGPLLARVDALLEKGTDVGAVREVLRALWVLLERHGGPARVELAEIGALLSMSVGRGEMTGARRALAAARTWFEAHQFAVARALRARGLSAP